MVKQFFTKLMDVPISDPDDARRKKLLNTLLVYMGLAAFIIAVASLVTVLAGLYEFRDVSLLMIICVAYLILDIIIFALNKRSGRLAAWMFLIVFTFVLALSDTPPQIGNGSSMFVFAIPIATASLLLSPASSFVFALLSAGIVTGLGVTNNFIPNIPTVFSFFLLALISWLSARGLESALKDLRAININLDRMVQERTKELANALSRERIESGRTKAILESIADGVIVFDLQGTSIIANSSTIQLLEMNSAELIGSTIPQLVQSNNLDSFNRGMLNNVLSHPSAKANISHIQWGKKDLSVTSAPVLDREGEPIGTVAVFRDYTHEAEVERMKNTFLAIVSHELRTPLNAILGYAEMLKEAVYGPVNEKQSRAAERIMTNSHRLLDIVSDLLDKAQMEAGKLSLHLQSFRPADLIDNVHSVMDKIAGDKGLALTSELDPGLPEFIVGDIARLQQILVNLINNSVKFTEKGSVHMCLSRKDKKHWLLKITDTGIGIPEEELPNIFEAFRQVDSTATRKYGGFGLGLSIVKQLAELMDGEVTVDSKLGTGSNFWVTLPLVQAKRSEK
jgi:PAS domain S-box-containing protein